ncbi:MAG: nucleotidyltransferase family protein [Armatimonadota bacterium]
MLSIDEIIKILNDNKSYIASKFGIKEIGVFGSYVRNEQTKDSDLDVLVDFNDGFKTFDNYMDLKFYLEELLSVKIDLVCKTSIKIRLKEYILNEVLSV